MLYNASLLGNQSSYFLIKGILTATKKLTYETAFIGKCDSAYAMSLHCLVPLSIDFCKFWQEHLLVIHNTMYT